MKTQSPVTFMKYVKIFWTVGCWISLFLVSVYHNIFHSNEPVLAVWYATLIVWVVGIAALSSLREGL